MSEKIFDTAFTDSATQHDPVEIVIKHLEFARKYTLSLLDGLADDDWFEMPQGITHIAWQVGHIAMSQYGLTLFRQRGRAEVDLKLMPSSFRKKFSRGTEPKPDREFYPAPDEIRAILNAVYEQALKEMPTFSQESLDQSVDPPHAAFATNYGALLFAVDHEMIHAGQIVILRRLIGKPPVR